MPITIRHLRLGSAAWCPRGGLSDDDLVDDVVECDCLDCLEAVRELAIRAHWRWSVVNRSAVGQAQHSTAAPIVPRFSR